jgi:hypothetical protein
MFWLLPLALIGIGLVAFDESNKTQEDMANCNKLFLDFEKKISLTKTQKEKLDNSRRALQDKIINYFKDREGVSVRATASKP